MTLRPENKDVETLMEKLRDIGWKDGKDCGLKEDKLVDGYYFQQFFERKFKEINSTTLSRLLPKKKEMLSNLLRTS